MKKIYTYLTLAMLAMLTFTSCESEEEQIARTLHGNWQGTMSDYYYSRWGDYLSGSQYYTYFSFTRSSNASGYGTEVDEDRYGNYVERDFSWTVDYDYGYNGYRYTNDYFTITLYYDSRYYYNGREVRTTPYSAVIYNAHLDDRNFYGSMEDSDGNLKQFSMRYMSSPWTRSVTRAAESDTLAVDSVKSPDLR